MGTIVSLSKDVIKCKNAKGSVRKEAKDSKKITINPNLFYLEQVSDERHKQSRLDAYEYIF